MPNCLHCGGNLLDSELAVGKCEECRKRESDITTQQQHDHEQHAKLQDDQQQDEKEQQEWWEKDYKQEMHRQEDQQRDLPQEESSQVTSLNDTLEDATKRYEIANASRGKSKKDLSLDL